MVIRIDQMMSECGVRFGTSGARGLVSQMSDRVCYAYTRGFLQMLIERGDVQSPYRVAIAGDRRSSSPRIMAAVAEAARDVGFEVINGGLVPSPAIALFGLQHGMASIMVTGSHIPDDRNGIKFNTPVGELLKGDEFDMLRQSVDIPDKFGDSGQLVRRGMPALPALSPEVERSYFERWVNAVPPRALQGKKIVVYGHSAVGRELLAHVYESLGADVVKTGWSEAFISVDTEAIRPQDVDLAQHLAALHRPYAIVSTDGDSDRPLISDEHGCWLRGDVIGVIAARWLNAEVVVTPVSSNSTLERVQCFKHVKRTAIGSPYVISAMNDAVREGYRCVVGYEANGGFLTATETQVPGGSTLSPLPTRDPIVVQLGVLLATLAEDRSISELMATLPARFTASDRIANFPTEVSRAQIGELIDGQHTVADELCQDLIGPSVHIDTTDGIRITGASGDIVHLRPSGNAPELRCYAESDSADRASWLTQTMLQRCKSWPTTAG